MTIRQGDKIVAGVVSNTDYNVLDNKPSINNIILNGNFSLSDLGIQSKGDFVSKQTFAEYVDTTALTLNSLKKEFVEKISHLENVNSFNIATFKNKINELKEECFDYTKLNNKPKINGIELSENIELTEAFLLKDGNYVTKEDVLSILTDYINKKDVYTIKEIDSLIENLEFVKNDDYVTKQKLTETLTNYISEEDLSLKIADELALVENFTPTPYIISVPDQTLEKSIEELKREDRDLAIYKISWRIERYRQQSELNIKTDDSKQVYINLLKYVQYLRDIPQNKDFPEVEILTFEEYLTTL